jgi:MOSC N-terminal beta barrel domain
MSPPSADDAERGTSDEEEGLNRASVTELWRFPVKSMGGVQVDEVRVDRRGVHADRLWAVRDLENDITATARKLPALLGCTARYLCEPGPAAGRATCRRSRSPFPTEPRPIALILLSTNGFRSWLAAMCG